MSFSIFILHLIIILFCIFPRQINVHLSRAHQFQTQMYPLINHKNCFNDNRHLLLVWMSLFAYLSKQKGLGFQRGKVRWRMFTRSCNQFPSLKANCNACSASLMKSLASCFCPRRYTILDTLFLLNCWCCSGTFLSSLR